MERLRLRAESLGRVEPRGGCGGCLEMNSNWKCFLSCSGRSDQLIVTMVPSHWSEVSRFWQLYESRCGPQWVSRKSRECLPVYFFLASAEQLQTEFLSLAQSLPSAQLLSSLCITWNREVGQDPLEDSKEISFERITAEFQKQIPLFLAAHQRIYNSIITATKDHGDSLIRHFNSAFVHCFYKAITISASSSAPSCISMLGLHAPVAPVAPVSLFQKANLEYAVDVCCRDLPPIEIDILPFLFTSCSQVPSELKRYVLEHRFPTSQKLAGENAEGPQSAPLWNVDQLCEHRCAPVGPSAALAIQIASRLESYFKPFGSYQGIYTLHVSFLLYFLYSDFIVLSTRCNCVEISPQ